MKTIQHLEFDKYLDIVVSICHSIPGKAYLKSIKPLSDIESINTRLNQINDIQSVIIKISDFDFKDIEDIEYIFTEIKTLAYNFEEFRAIIRIISLSNMILSYNEKWIDYPSFKNFVKPLIDYKLFEIKFNQIFSDEGEVLDTASTTLKNIRQRIRKLKDKIQSELNRTINNSQLESYFQDKIVTKRDERFVIPVKEGFAYMIDGISHGRSGSGASIFIEPKAVVPLNNELNDLFKTEKEEIYRIFCEFTAEIRNETEGILNNFKIIYILDAYFAVARISNQIQAIVPEISKENILILKRVRHPLLILKFGSIKKVIPYDLSLGDKFKTLLISGPNTGGKTITLKSVGLCVLMALSGLPIPADYGTKIGLLSGIYADIGDNQSIESSLSTYSGHIENIKHLIVNSNENSLVLIDEIGSATDPEQGAALAQAILEKLVEKKVLAVITTHYTSLKVFAENNSDCVNASMQFDPEKHEPTYQFVLGFPGNSFAIEIASKLGLDQQLIDRAKELSGNQNIMLTDLLKKMNDEKKKLAQNNFNIELKTKLLELKVSEYEDKLQELDSNKKKLIKSSLKETQDYLTNIQKKLNNELTEIDKISKQEKKEKIKQLNKKVNVFQSDVNTKKLNLEPDKRVKPDKVDIGSNVWVRKFETEAIIVDIQKDFIRVDMNGIFFNVKADDIYQLDKTRKDEAITLVSRKNVNFQNKAKMEINLLGKTFDESKPLIQEFIDNALFCGLSKIRIVHGKGTGVLRKKVRDYLKKHPKVQEFYAPTQEAGGDGVTVVSLI
ncbi:MAG: endonuclease MutS2 [Candidatus Cloacimonetes bacterium]|nr:endonuclease MutS2 [Candidatus Cloacimonadota bacterium]